MARPRKPDALTAAQRQQRYRQAHDLCTLKVPRPLVGRLDAAAREHGVGRIQALALALGQWEASGRRDREASTGAMASLGETGGARHKAHAGHAKSPALPSGQQDWFGMGDADG